MDYIGYSWIAENLNCYMRNKPMAAFFDQNAFRSCKDRTVIPYYSKNLSQEDYSAMDLKDHLLFALREEKLDPYILRKGFVALDKEQTRAIAVALNNTPTSPVLRKAAYLYEVFTGQELGKTKIAEDYLSSHARSFVPLLDPDKYYVLTKRFPDKISKKYRIFDNSLGRLDICAPIIERTELLQKHASMSYGQKMYDAFKRVEEDDGKELSSFVKDQMYICESQMTFEIENDTRDAKRITAYCNMLKKYGNALPYLSKKVVLDMQHVIVSPAEYFGDYRRRQNFIGHRVRMDLPHVIDYISPPPECVDEFMAGIYKMHYYLSADPDIDPVAAGAAMHLAFTALHPLSDGNGRISRTLLHDQLAKHSFIPQANGLIIPISDIIAKNKRKYESALDFATGHILSQCEYNYDEEGYLQVKGNDPDLYRYLDGTKFAEYLYDAVGKTVDETVPHILKEAAFKTKALPVINSIYPMTAKESNYFLHGIIAQKGLLSNNLRKKMARAISSEKLSEMINSVGDIYTEIYSPTSAPSAPTD